MKNKIQKLNIKGFTKFIDTQDIEFCNGINVFIGTNGVGKTHLLKLLYLITKSIKNQQFNENLKENLKNFFKTDLLSSLISKFSEQDNANVNLLGFEKEFWFDFKSDESLETSVLNDLNLTDLNPVYIPPQEMLSTYLEFIPFYEKYKTGYEQFYYDLAKSLMQLELKSIDENFLKISEIIEKSITGKLSKEREHFYLNYKFGKIEAKIEASLLAEGIKKISVVDYLIKSGSIDKNSVLFWDEPEVHINPRLISVLTDIIKLTANEGVQIFLSSHDHLLTQQISLLDEYRATSKMPIPEIKFFVLKESLSGETLIECGNNLTDLQYNPILEEYLSQHDKEQNLFNLSISEL